MKLDLTVMPGAYAICRLDGDSIVPPWASRGGFTCVARTPDELSIVCRQGDVPGDVRHEPGWRVIKLEGPFDLAAVGVLAALAEPLARSGINIFVVSTFDTDYLLVQDEKLRAASSALRTAGHTVAGGGR